MIQSFVNGDIVSSLIDDYDKLRFVIHFGCKIALCLISFRHWNLAIRRGEGSPWFEEEDREVRNGNIGLLRMGSCEMSRQVYLIRGQAVAQRTIVETDAANRPYAVIWKRRKQGNNVL